MESLKRLAKKLLGCDVDNENEMKNASPRCTLIDLILKLFGQWVEYVVSHDCAKKRVKRAESETEIDLESEVVYLEEFTEPSGSLEGLVDLSKRQYDLKTIIIVIKQMVCRTNVFAGAAASVFNFRELEILTEEDQFLFQINVEIASDLGCCIVKQIIN